MTKDRFEGRYLDSTGKPVTRAPDAILPSTNAVVFNGRGEVLLQRRSDNGFWALPGGGVEVGESVGQGVIRETLEETGLRVTVKRLVGLYSDPEHYCIMSYPDGKIIHYVAAVFECERESGELRISDESTDIGYFPVDALPSDTLLSHRLRIEDALADRPEPFIR